MSTTGRIVSGTAASWVRMGITICIQLALVPVYLSGWDIQTYAAWLAIQAYIGLTSRIDVGHQTYLYYEFLKAGELDRQKLSLYLGSGIRAGIMSGSIQLILVTLLILGGTLGRLFGIRNIDNPLLKEVNLSLFLQTIVWVFFGIISGLMGQLLTVFGHYARVQWWNVLGIVIFAVFPATGVLLNFGLLGSSLLLMLGSCLYYILYYWDLLIVLKREKITYLTWSRQISQQNFVKSLTLSAKDILENFRQQGVRVILGALVGASGLAIFTTIRTGSNLLMQGLNTVSFPMVPELMRFINQRNQKKMVVIITLIWGVLITFLSPGFLLLQFIVEPIYNSWTKGRLEFDSQLFVVLSISVLIYTASQPAVLIVNGNNLLKSQLKVSINSLLILLASLPLTTWILGITGAGISILLAELVSAWLYIRVAKNWLLSNNLLWPNKQYTVALVSIFNSSLSMLLIVFFINLKWYILCVSFAIHFISISRYYWISPALVKDRINSILKRLNFDSENRFLILFRRK